ncbi:hypothetical protein [Nocardia transvalensis]|uniref:hypothetical protein n=1 Tax=Nocardia transvalensis TaxID=37333 RepID=UPI0018955747|nr:hypothetical protein [Nocardia transvalensis]MBF6332345.1 hypothetical protein [Nocardia transvalensis]
MAATTDSAHVCCARYRDDHGLDVTIDAHGHIVLHAGAVDAIQMPEQLAEQVQAELRNRAIATPAILHTGTRYRTFLSHGAGRDERPVRMFGSLYRYQAIRTVTGSLVMLPGPADTVRIWLEEPDGTQRPEFETLVAVTLDAAKRLPKGV